MRDKQNSSRETDWMAAGGVRGAGDKVLDALRPRLVAGALPQSSFGSCCTMVSWSLSTTAPWPSASCPTADDEAASFTDGASGNTSVPKSGQERHFGPGHFGSSALAYLAGWLPDVSRWHAPLWRLQHSECALDGAESDGHQHLSLRTLLPPKPPSRSTRRRCSIGADIVPTAMVLRGSDSACAPEGHSRSLRDRKVPKIIGGQRGRDTACAPEGHPDRLVEEGCASPCRRAWRTSWRRTSLRAKTAYKIASWRKSGVQRATDHEGIRARDSSVCLKRRHARPSCGADSRFPPCHRSWRKSLETMQLHKSWRKS